MRYKTGRNIRIRRRATRAAIGAMLLANVAGCASDEIALAPDSPNTPWPLPRASDVSQQFSRAGGSPAAAGMERNAITVEPGRVYALPELIDLAARHNPATRIAWEQARQAALGVGLVETAFLPQITAEAVGGVQSTPLPVPKTLIARGYFTSTTYEVIPTVTAKFLLFDFGHRRAEVAAARANSFVANVAFTAAHRKLIYEVSRDYFALGAARGRQRVAEDSLRLAQTVQGATEARAARGLATSVELAQVRRQTAQARFGLVGAEGKTRESYAALIASMGIAPDHDIDVADSSALPLAAAPGGRLEEYVAGALAQRPDIIAGLGKVEQAASALAAARATQYPTLAVEASAFENIGALSSDGGPVSTVSRPGGAVLFKLSYPLFDGGQRAAQIMSAGAELEAARSALDQSRDEAASQVSNAYDALRTSYAQYTAALAFESAAQTAYAAALAAYQHQVGTYTDTVNGENSLSLAQSAREDAHANVLTAAAALAFVTGAPQLPHE